jgi:DNA-binding IclR family transcriptional regulator
MPQVELLPNTWPRVLALGHSYISSMPLSAMTQPILEGVSRILHESCSIATLDRADIVCIARANVTRIMSIDLVVGSRLPAFCTSVGRVLMADLPQKNSMSFSPASNSGATRSEPYRTPKNSARFCDLCSTTATALWIKSWSLACAPWQFPFAIQPEEWLRL